MVSFSARQPRRVPGLHRLAVVSSLRLSDDESLRALGYVR